MLFFSGMCIAFPKSVEVKHTIYFGLMIHLNNTVRKNVITIAYCQ